MFASFEPSDISVYVNDVIYGRDLFNCLSIIWEVGQGIELEKLKSYILKYLSRLKRAPLMAMASQMQSHIIPGKIATCLCLY